MLLCGIQLVKKALFGKGFNTNMQKTLAQGSYSFKKVLNYLIKMCYLGCMHLYLYSCLNN